MSNQVKLLTTIAAAGGFCLATGSAFAFRTTEDPMITASDHTVGNWKSLPLLTIGEEVFGYRAPGLPDGMGAYRLDATTVRLLVNHEIPGNRGYLYSLANGTGLRGGRVSYLDIDRNSREIEAIGPAYSTIIDRYGVVVTDGSQIAETDAPTTNGLDRLCSANLFQVGQYGIVDDMFFTGEETDNGQEFVLEVATGVLHCAPALGRAAWESLTLITPPDEFSIAAIIGDDRQGAPLLLYIGQKDYYGNGSFLDRNGLAYGRLYAWVSDAGYLNPEDWNGTGNHASGTFVEIPYYQPGMAGMPGWDEAGWADQSTQDAMVAAVGGFAFSRPEDVHANPANGLEVAFASTGRGSAYPSDNWGTTYILSVAYGETITCGLGILYDGDDAGDGQFPGPDYGLRSPDNLEWAANGQIYIQEDRSTSPGSLFGGTSGREASVWAADPITGELERILEIDRSAVPTDQTDPQPTDIGNWESSGVIDVSHLFPRIHTETVLLLNVEAHNLVGEPLGGSNQANDLVEGGQILLCSSTNRANAVSILPGQGGNGLAVGSTGLENVSSISLSAGPNPTSKGSNLTFALSSAAEVSLEIYDVNGRLVQSLVQGPVAAGEHVAVWDGRDAQGREVGSGVYFARLATPEMVDEAKITVRR